MPFVGARGFKCADSSRQSVARRVQFVLHDMQACSVRIADYLWKAADDQVTR